MDGGRFISNKNKLDMGRLKLVKILEFSISFGGCEAWVGWRQSVWGDLHHSCEHKEVGNAFPSRNLEK